MCAVNVARSYVRACTTGWSGGPGGPGGPCPLYFSAEQKTFMAQKQMYLKTRLGMHFL